MSLAIATCTFYRSADEVRAQLTLRTLQGAKERNIPVAIVDGGSAREVVESFRKLGAHVFRQEDKSFGSAWRQAIREANSLSNGVGVLRTEPEKYSFLDIIPEVAPPILNGTADIVIGDRRPLYSFPEIQMHEESFGDKYVSDLLGVDIDLFAAPSAIGPEALPLFLNYVPQEGAKDMWDTILLPILQAIAQGLRVANIPSSYVHPPEMKKAEEGDLRMNQKRYEQIRDVLADVLAEARRLGISRF